MNISHLERVIESQYLVLTSFSRCYLLAIKPALAGEFCLSGNSKEMLFCLQTAVCTRFQVLLLDKDTPSNFKDRHKFHLLVID